MINRLPWHKKLRTSSANNLDKINEIIDYINHSDISEVALSETVSGRNVQAGKASSLKDLTVYGESIQNGTPTPDNPVPVQVVEGGNLLKLPTWNELQNCELTNGYRNFPIQVEPNKQYYLSTIYDSTGSATYGGYALVSYDKTNSNWKAISHAVQGVVNGVITTDDSGMIYVNVNMSQTQYEYVLQHAMPQIELGSTATPYVPYGNIGLQIDETITPIDLQGNVLASLPDGTHDELKIDSAGHVTLIKATGIANESSNITLRNTSSIRSAFIVESNVKDIPVSVTAPILSTNWVATNGITTWVPGQVSIFNDGQGSKIIVMVDPSITTVNDFLETIPVFDIYYPLATPITIDLGYITPPAIATDDEIEIIATITPLIDVGYWSYSEFSEMIADLKAYVDYKTTEESNALGVHSLNPINIRENLPTIEPVEVSDILESEA